MNLDAYKELVPVVYGEISAKFLIGTPQAPGKHCIRLHWHERMEVLRIWEGSLSLQVGPQTLTAQAGDAVLICPCQVHQAAAGPEGVRYDVIMFDLTRLSGDTIASTQYLLPLVKGELTFPVVTDQPESIAIIDRLLTLYHHRESINPLRIAAGLYELLGCLYECFPQDKTLAEPGRESFRHVVSYVNENFTQEMTTGSLSRQFGYNEAYFCRQFKKVTGLNAMKYIQILRLEAALKKLERSREPVALIAAQCGFADVSHFTHCFTRHFHISPQAFRKASQAQKPKGA